MIRLLRLLLDRSYSLLEKKKAFQPLKPVLDATDAFFFSKAEVTIEAPHLRDHIDLKRYMIVVVVALLPTTLASLYFFGWRVLVLIVVSYIFGGLTEVLFAVVRKEEISEGFLVTGLVFPLTLPPTIPLWMVVVGVVAGVIFGKEVFGGTGKNIFNPAMVGRIFLAVTFPSTMTTRWLEPLGGGLAGFKLYTTDAITAATPLINYKGSGAIESLGRLFIGNVPGSLGETSGLLIILGGVFLMFTKVSNWRIPVAYLGTAAVFSLVMSFLLPGRFAPPLFQLLSGGLLFGAMFMATDPVTCPFTKSGKWVYGISLGLLTVAIRGLSGYVEGVMFAIIFMNVFAPLIDHVVLSLRYKVEVTS